MAISKQHVRAIRERLEAVIAEVAAEFDLHSSIGTMRYTSNNISCKLELSGVSDDTGIIHGPEADRFLVSACMYGLNREDLGRWFTSNSGTRQQIVGLNARAKRYPIICRDEQGRRFKFAATSVRYYLDAEKATA